MIPLWWEILKNAKLSGKAKGKSFDASKIKINIDDKDDCKRELKKILSKALEMNINRVANVRLDKKFIDNELSEKRACEFVKTLKYKLSLIHKLEDSIKFGVGSYPSNYVKYDSITVRKLNGIAAESGEKIEFVAVSLVGGETKPTQFGAFTFAKPEEYDKWVNLI